MIPDTLPKNSSEPEGCAGSAFSVWRIQSVRWNHTRTEGKESNEYVAAKTIDDVWEYLRFDRADEGVEIKGIFWEVPLTKILSQNSQEQGRPTE
jgi:hypothetical protein